MRAYLGRFLDILGWKLISGSIWENTISLTVVTQEYKTYVNQAHVIRGNDVLVKCDIPSFVTDFVSVQSWVDSEGKVHSSTSNGN